MSQAAFNYYLNEASNLINQISSSQQSVAQLQATAHALERVVLQNVFTDIDSLMASEPTLQNNKVLGSDDPIVQILDTSGVEEYRIELPTRNRLQQAYHTYLTGSGYNPSSAVDANAYWQKVQGELSTQSNETQNFAVVEMLAEDVEKQVPALLDQLHIVDPPLREWLLQLAWEAGDGNDRSRELFANTLISYIMSMEIDDYSTPGQIATQQRILLRTTGAVTDYANSLLDEINGNVDTVGLQDCFVPLTDDQTTANQTSLANLIRYIPSLNTPTGIEAALAIVDTNASDPDILAEVSAELLPKGTSSDPVLAAILAAAQYAVQEYQSADPTQLLLNVEAAANSFLQASEAAFGPNTSCWFRTMVAISLDGRLSGVRRREALVALREALIPSDAKATYDEIASLLWMLGNKKIDNNAYTQTTLQIYETALADNYWMLKSFADVAFTTSDDLTNALTASQAAITADLAQAGTLLTSADIGTLTDALNRLATVSVTPEDRTVQFNRIRDIGQRMSNSADVSLFRLYIDVLVGGGYLADVEYDQNYQTLLIEALQEVSRDVNLIPAELQAFGNIGFSSTFIDSLIVELQLISGNFFSSTDTLLTTASPLGTAAAMLDTYWTSIVDVSAPPILADAIMLSRTLNTVTDPVARSLTISTDKISISQLSNVDTDNVLALYTALVGYTKPTYVQAQETAYLTKIIQGNSTVQLGYTTLQTSVAAAVAGTEPDVAYYPLILFTKQNEYQAGLVIRAANLAVQGGRTNSNVKNSVSIISGSGYSKSYFPQGHNDVVSQVQYSAAIPTYTGEQPVSNFQSSTLTDPNPVYSYTPDVRTSDAQNNFVQDMSSSGGGANSGNLQEAICKMDMLFNMIQQLNGTVDSVTGAVTGGINNAIGSINSAISGLFGKLNSAIQGVGNMGSINLKVNCKCMSFDLSTILQKLLKPISSWLTSFGGGGFNIPQLKNPFQGLQNPFKLNPALGCPQTLGAFGANILSS